MSDNPENLPARSDDRFLPARVDHVSGTLALIKSAIDKGIDPEALGKLLDLQDRVMAKQAAMAFNEAKKRFQAECRPITKNRTAEFKSTKYTFADLEQVTQSIRPLLEKHGFSYSFDQTHNGGIIQVTCYLRHEQGHQEATTFSAPWGTNAGMSEAQKYASATTFCQRYALRLALGLPVGEDNDGREEHEKPEQRSDAPAPSTREQRQRQPDSPVVTTAMVLKIVAEWKTQQPGTPDAEKFPPWVFATVGREFNTRKAPEWTWADFEKCCKALGVPTE